MEITVISESNEGILHPVTGQLVGVAASLG